MNLKTTIALLILAGGCALLFWKGEELAPRLGLAPRPDSSVDAGTFELLKDLPVNQITRIEIDVAGQSKLVLQAAEGQPLELPGNWPIRRSEVDEMLHLLHDLKSRYQPIPIDDKTDLAPFGLSPEQKPITVLIVTPKETLKLLFGEAPLQEGENPFTRATYVRLESKNEVLRLGPQVIPTLKRSEEVYRRRQLFPEAARARILEPKRLAPPGLDEPSPGAVSAFLADDRVDRIAISVPSGRFVLERVGPTPKAEPPADKPDADPVVQPARLAQSWILAEPYRDRLDPEKARAILTAVPSLWVEKFVPEPQGQDYFYGLGAHPGVIPQLFTLLGGAIPNGAGDTPLRALLNYASLGEAVSPTATVTVTLKDGSSRTLQIGRVAGATGSNESRFAKLENNPIVFELKADKLNDLQINFTKSSGGSPASPASDLRDPVLARFDTNQVSGIDIVAKGDAAGRQIKLEKTGDDWKMVQPVADAADRTAVADLLGFLKGIEARSDSIVDGPPSAAIVGFAAVDPKVLFGLTPELAKRVTLTFDAKSGLKPVTFLIGARNPTTNKRSVMVEGWGRINNVEDRLDSQQASRLDRQPSSYRTLKLFDPIVSKIEEIVVQRSAADMRPADTFTLQEQAGPPPKWSITAPFKAEADSAAANQLAMELGNLGTQKFVYDSATDQPFTIKPWPPLLEAFGVGPLAGDALFGFDRPILTLVLKFKEPKGAEDIVVEIGRARSDTEFYARRKGSTGVFVVSDRVVKAANQKAEDLVDKALFHFASKPDVQSIRRQMGGQEFEIVQNNSALWEFTKPSQAKADQAKVDELAQQLGQLRASRIEAVVPKSLKEYGLEPPVAVVTVEALDKNKLITKSLLVGNPVDALNPAGDRFVKAEDSPMVAVLPAVVAQKLVAEPGKFRDLSVGGFVTADKIVMEKGDRKITFVKGANGWKATEPVGTDAEDEDLRELHDQLAKLRAEDLVEDKPKDLAKYGLDKPAHWLVFNGDREVMHLLVGTHEKVGPDKMSEGIRSYAKLEKGDAVYLLDWRLSHLLSSEFRKRAVWDRVPPMQITEISIKAPEGKDSFTFVKGPLGWTDPAKPDDKLDQELVNDLVLGLAGLHVDHYVVDKDANLAKFGLDKPRIVTVTTADGKKRVVLLGNLSEEKLILAKLDDPARTDVFLLDPTDSLSLKRPRADYRMKMKEEPKKDEPKKEEPKKDQK
jgi:Domain of unknown function (DUF4340)